MSVRGSNDEEGEEAGGGFSPDRLLSALRRRVRLIIAVALTVTIAAVLIAMAMPNRYDASAVIQIDPRKKSIANIEGALSDLKADHATVDSEVEVVRSRGILVRVIDILGLRSDEEFVGPSRWRKWAIQIGLVSATEPSAVGAARAPPPTDRDPIGSILKGQPPRLGPERDEVAVALSDKLKVTRVRSTLLIEVKVSSADPAKAARIANTIAEVYLADQIEQKSRASGFATDLLEQKIAEMKTQVVEAERKVVAYKAQHGIIDTEGGATLAEKQLARLMEQAVNARNHSAEVRAKFEQAQKLARKGDAVTSLGDVLQSNTIRTLKEQLTSAQRREAELSTRYGPNHPEMRKVRAEIAEAQGAVDGEVGRIVISLKNDLETAEEREQQLTANLQTLKAQQLTSKDAGVELKQLEREAQTSKQLFEALLSRMKQTAETRGLHLPDARIVEPADTPLFPTSPKRKLIAIAGLIGGILAGMMAALSVELFTSGLARPEDVEHVLEVTHLSSLPHVGPGGAGQGSDDMRSVRLVVAEPGGAFTEAIRSVRREIDLRRSSRLSRVIVVASSLPGEGSGVVASNLAHHYALTGGSVLLIDGDLRRAALSRQLGGGRGIGLLEALGLGQPVEQAILRDATTGLHFLPAMGPAPVRMSSPELIGSQRMHIALDDLRRQFDTIVIDAPPLLPVIDGRILADLADQILFVMTWRRTPKKMAQRALKTLGANSGKILGVVVTEVDEDIIAASNGTGDQIADALPRIAA